MTSNPDLKGMPIFEIEYLRNGSRQIHSNYRQLIESDMWHMWPIELYHHQ